MLSRMCPIPLSEATSWALPVRRWNIWSSARSSPLKALNSPGSHGPPTFARNCNNWSTNGSPPKPMRGLPARFSIGAALAPRRTRSLSRSRFSMRERRSNLSHARPLFNAPPSANWHSLSPPHQLLNSPQPGADSPRARLAESPYPPTRAPRNAAHCKYPHIQPPTATRYPQHPAQCNRLDIQTLAATPQPPALSVLSPATMPHYEHRLFIRAYVARMLGQSDIVG